MKIKSIILAILFASLMSIEPMAATPIKQFRSAYATIRSDMRSLFGNKKLDPEQKKRMMIELAVGMAIVIITGGTIWFWWVRPLQDQLYSATKTLQQIIDTRLRAPTKVDDDELLEILRQHPPTKRILMLHLASKRSDCVAIVDYLIESGLSVDARINGETPLHCAASAEQEKVVKLLLEKRADPTIQNNNGETPHHVAKEGSSIQATLAQAELDWGQKHLV